ncbi:MAG TPA: NifB/NifX family molybdenum-iron cluster-binding protein [Bryobacteraceae bacterium]|jgi:predicted Fe-Mo cluster-binding NifX family protein|nr:NifB/NifX family molybdenum-iron cluster-binding protein [Bryobacteraceae bacterium]
MKIAVSAKGESLVSEVDPRFGRAAWFLAFETDDGTWQAVNNTIAISATHGAGIQSAETVCRLGAGAVISGHIGPKAFAVLAAGGVKVYQGDARTVQMAIDDFKGGRLPEIERSNG